MNKRIILSVNTNEDYAYFLPLTCWAWRKFGWEPLIIHVGQWTEFIDMAFGNESWFVMHGIDGIRDSTIAQVSRLYGAEFHTFEEAKGIDRGDLVMLGDIDLIPLGDHWNPDADKVTVYNHDLTGRTEIPMCFVAAPAKLWGKFMNYSGHPSVDIERDLSNYENAKSDDFYKWWGCDQQILTDRLKKYGYDKIKFIDRGPSDLHGYARGRVDRAPGGWRFDLPELIDAHMEQQTHHDEKKIARLLDLLRHVWPNEDWSWFRKYTNDFREITGRERLTWLE